MTTLESKFVVMNELSGPKNIQIDIHIHGGDV